MKYTSNKYPVNIRYSAEDRGFIATIPDILEFAYCAGYGKTRKKALKHIKQARKMIVESFKADEKRKGSHD